MAIMARHASLDDAVVSHYHLVAPIMEQLFGQSPLIWVSYPKGIDSGPQWHYAFLGHYKMLTAKEILHLVSVGALEFYSWFPTPQDTSRARFMRLLLCGHEPHMKEAALAVCGMLLENGRESLPVLDGYGNIELWVPVAGAPAYDRVRGYLHRFANRVVERHGNLVSLAPNVVHDSRVHLHVSHNAERLGTVVPYSYRARTGRVATPIYWQEVGEMNLRGVRASELPKRLAEHGEVFAAQLATMSSAALPEAPTAIATVTHDARAPRGAVLNAALSVLSDGRPRSAQEIWEAVRERGVVRSVAHAIEIALLQYIARRESLGRRPLIIETLDHRFRLNEPLDAWPVVPTPPARQTPAHVQEIIARLNAAGEGTDPTAFEIAVCDAFNALGFITSHIGGHGAPDGYADAPLGTLGYRVMLECKSGRVGQKGPDVFEAAKYKEAYRAQYCAIVAAKPSADEHEILSEMKTHGVSLWGIDDLAYALQQQLTPLELEPMFAPVVVAADSLIDALWERNHGESKRVRIVTEIIRASGWETQCAAAQAGTPADAPVLTEDAAMLLVDQELLAQGCHVNCTRDQVREALAWLTHPMVALATWTAGKTGIVLNRNIQGGENT